jgi:hypothetical protein
VTAFQEVGLTTKQPDFLHGVSWGISGRRKPPTVPHLSPKAHAACLRSANLTWDRWLLASNQNITLRSVEMPQ